MSLALQGHCSLSIAARQATAVLLQPLLYHVSRKFAAINNSNASSGATLNSGMFRVVLQMQHNTDQHTFVIQCLGLKDALACTADVAPTSRHESRAVMRTWEAGADKAGPQGT